PGFAEHPPAADAAAQVRERVRALRRGIRIVVLVLAVADDVGAGGERRRRRDGPRVLYAEIRGVVRRVRQRVAADVHAVRRAAGLEPRVRVAEAAEDVEPGGRPRGRLELQSLA